MLAGCIIFFPRTSQTLTVWILLVSQAPGELYNYRQEAFLYFFIFVHHPVCFCLVFVSDFALVQLVTHNVWMACRFLPANAKPYVLYIDPLSTTWNKDFFFITTQCVCVFIWNSTAVVCNTVYEVLDWQEVLKYFKIDRFWENCGPLKSLNSLMRYYISWILKMFPNSFTATSMEYLSVLLVVLYRFNSKIRRSLWRFKKVLIRISADTLSCGEICMQLHQTVLSHMCQ